MNVVFYLIMLHKAANTFRYIPEDVRSVSSNLGNSLTNSIATIEDIPHHVLIAYGRFYCSGALVRSLIVVTTASCFAQRSEQKVFVKAGTSTTTGYGQVIPVVQIKLHEYYEGTSAVNNDIALLVLENGLDLGYKVKKIILVEPEVAIRVGTNIEVSGWGYSSRPSKFSNQLIWSDMVVLDKTECQQYHGGLITSSSFCAKYKVERRLSDNGGPAVYQGLLVGLLSFGANNREGPRVAVFTNVSYFHRWITLNCRRFLERYCISEDDYSYSEETVKDE